jgi:glycosyltransferase involved in cell wall biosynthesis
MTAWAFSLVYNESVLIRYWVRHYLTVCERVIVYYDIDSDDGTEDIVEEEGGEARPYFGSGHLDDIEFIRFAEDRYKEARGNADWVIWADADEFLYHPYLWERLNELTRLNVTLPRVDGYDMFSDAPPSGSGQIYHKIRKGVKSSAYDKICIFDPKLDVKWTTGKHRASIPHGMFQDSDMNIPLKLLHYRWLGEQWYLARNARNYSRLDARNIAAQHGRETYPGATGEYSPPWYAEQAKIAKEVI